MRDHDQRSVSRICPEELHASLSDIDGVALARRARRDLEQRGA